MSELPPPELPPAAVIRPRGETAWAEILADRRFTRAVGAAMLLLVVLLSAVLVWRLVTLQDTAGSLQTTVRSLQMTVSVQARAICTLSDRLAANTTTSDRAFAFDRAERRLVVDLAMTDRADFPAAIRAIREVDLTPPKPQPSSCPAGRSP